MKNLKLKSTIAIFAILIFSSCNNSDEQSYEIEQTEVTIEDNLIERDIMQLSSLDALKLAKQFSNNEYERSTRTVSDITIKNIQTVTSELGEPLMYVVNYTNDNGFIVISATKNYIPILAYSDEGHLNVNDESFTNNIFIHEYKTYINSVINTECDSLRQRYAINWSFYEKKPKIIESRTYTDAQIQQELANARTYYSNQGYEVHSLGAATSLIPAAGGQSAEDRANGFIRDICSHTPSQYDCMDVTLLLVKRYETSYGPYISTSWHQHSPYCTDASNGYAGCWTIATTQLMKYYEWPTSFNWNNIRDAFTEPLSQDETNLMNLRKEMSPQYDTNGTGILIDKAQEMLQKYGYIVTQQVYPGYNSIMSEIKERRPVLMNGGDNNGDRHAWICDGYKYSSVQYAAYMIDRDFDEYIFFSGMTDHYLTEYLHMNMGWNDDKNNKIWCYYDSVLNYTEGRNILKVQPNR